MRAHAYILLPQTGRDAGFRLLRDRGRLHALPTSRPRMCDRIDITCAKKRCAAAICLRGSRLLIRLQMTSPNSEHAVSGELNGAGNPMSAQPFGSAGATCSGMSLTLEVTCAHNVRT
jgi:hypothetical protein